MRNLKDIWTRNLTEEEDYCFRVGWRISAVLNGLAGFLAGIVGTFAYILHDNAFLWNAFRATVQFCLQ